MAILALHHASVLVSDTARALQFYCAVLGLELEPNRPELGYPGAWLRINAQQQIHLLELPNPENGLNRPTHGGHDRHIALYSNDLETIVQRLQTAQIPFTRSQSGRQALFCRDPDGNAIELIYSPT
ncbi:MAG: VOC family protein [Thiothrix sp.]